MLTDEQLELAKSMFQPSDWDEIPEMANIKRIVNGLGYVIISQDEYTTLQAKKGAFDEIFPGRDAYVD